MKLLIISDLHAHSGTSADAAPPSFFYTGKDPDSDNQNVLSLIPEVLEAEGIKVDLLLCPGDIADKADPTAQRFAWNELVKVRKQVGAKHLIASAGNHDVDSRMKHSDFDPKGSLQTLDPPFPGLNEATCDRYWSKNFHVYTQGDVRIVNLNSSAFHGYHSDDIKDTSKSEYRHGRISQITINRICSHVKKKNFKTNILLTHHHLYRNDNIYDADYSEMTYGGKLVDSLMSATESAWLVIHGHQHFPEVTYSRGAAHASTIFSSGSLSASLVAPYSSEATNQFYVITLEHDTSLTKGWSPCGTVRAWQWANRRKWVRSHGDKNIADGTGFGCRALPSQVAQSIASSFFSSGSSLSTGAEIYSAVPELRFMTREAKHQVLEMLESHGIKWVGGSDFLESVFRRK
ncbi:3',5'-cyclic AMP phosphodiesterase CpdA [Methylobacterium sp. RAS18]|nr:3',5'-cyclic AMP phosphodiesterase CpdA [Methylobacterium sp. RAS18]